MKKTEAISNFLNWNSPFSDYWSMQLAWEIYKDNLNREGTITMKQFNNWDNPCTPETFKRFNKRFKGEF